MLFEYIPYKNALQSRNNHYHRRVHHWDCGLSYHSLLGRRIYPLAECYLTRLLYYYSVHPVSFGSGLSHSSLRNINHNRAFVLQNVKLLKIISLCCLIIALIFFCSVFFIDSIFSFIIVLAFAMAALLFYVIGESFRVATKYKEENDLTI